MNNLTIKNNNVYNLKKKNNGNKISWLDNIMMNIARKIKIINIAAINIILNNIFFTRLF